MYKNIVIISLLLVYAVTGYVSYGVFSSKTIITNPVPVQTKTIKPVIASKTIVAKPKSIVTNNVELTALAVTLYCEARGESQYGIAAVADTIRNRVKSPLFPNTYYDVVTQRKQFSCIHDINNIMNNAHINNAIDKRNFSIALKVAKRTIDGNMNKMTYNALFYHTKNIHPFWANKYNKLGVIGHHIFYTTTKL